MEQDSSGWRVLIMDASGGPVFERAFGDEADAELFLSTVEQHISWLSEEKFRRYYRIAEPEGV